MYEHFNLQPSTICHRVFPIRMRCLTHNVVYITLMISLLISSMSLLNHQPFLALVLTCLKGNDNQREGMLSSLQSQLDKFVSCAMEDCLPTETQLKQLMHEALQLRLSLVSDSLENVPVPGVPAGSEKDLLGNPSLRNLNCHLRLIYEK